MPDIEITYAGLIRTAVGCRRERLQMPDGATLAHLVGEVVRRHGSAARDHLVDGAGSLLPHAAIVIDGTGVRELDALIPSGVVVRILVLSPVMVGG
ncbi:MAG: MoaD/ThiS family protein [Candidatus Rokubacteria bacterium]|nr:MoaD/ThiS family protein [Candidatus Rokubacteria bacterium]